MMDPLELERERQRMKQDWEQRSGQDAEKYVYTRDLATDEADLEASGRINFEQLVKPFLPVLLRGRPPKQCRVAEIGCGVGRMTRSLADAFLEVHGVDISPQMVQKAKDRLREHANVRLEVNSGTDLGCLPTNYFDLVFSFLVFQHIPSKQIIENYMVESARILRPGGAILIQLNGDWANDDPRRVPDTWIGETVSFVAACRMLARSGFQPITATGAGTQYLLLAARRIEAGSTPLTSFILPGASASPEQFLEGWEAVAPDGYRPVGPRCRTLLAMPEGPERRLFLSLYFPPLDPFPGAAFSVKVNERLLESVRPSRSGDHCFEWSLPSSVGAESRAVVTLEFVTAQLGCLPWVRSMGIVGPDSSNSLDSLRVWELEERIAWSRELEAQLAHSQELLEKHNRQLRGKGTSPCAPART
jgi:SAM-dependent methyltransferase